MSLKKRLKKLQGNLKQADFIRKCGIPGSTMRGYLSGKRRNIGLDQAEKIAKANGVSVEWLLYGPHGEIKDISNNDLRAIYGLDDEIIDIENEIKSRPCPVVKAYDNESNNLVFYCIHCGKYHLHGRGGPKAPFQKGREGYAGYKSPHCTAKNSPFLATGYILEVIGRKEDIPKKRKLKTLYCPKCYSIYSRAFAACECGYINEKLKTFHKEMAEIYQTRISDSDKVEHEEQVQGNEDKSFLTKNASHNIIQQTGNRTAQAVQNGNIISQEGKEHHPHEILPHFPNRSMQELAEWINMQDDGINYWEILKGKLAQEFPEFRSWLKKRTATAAGQRNENISVNDK